MDLLIAATAHAHGAVIWSTGPTALVQQQWMSGTIHPGPTMPSGDEPLDKDALHRM